MGLSKPQLENIRNLFFLNGINQNGENLNFLDKLTLPPLLPRRRDDQLWLSQGHLANLNFVRLLSYKRTGDRA